MYRPLDIANWFLVAIDREAGDSITHLKLQKLVYYAQAWSLASLDRELFEEDFRGWIHGPVLPTLYQEFNRYGWDALPSPLTPLSDFDDVTRLLLGYVDRIYGGLRAKQLEMLTHQEQPWLEARKGLRPDERGDMIMTKSSMEAYYKSLLENRTNDLTPNIGAFSILPIVAEDRSPVISENEVDDITADQVIAQIMEEYDEAWTRLAHL